jgi:hypothetical protein
VQRILPRAFSIVSSVRYTIAVVVMLRLLLANSADAVVIKNLAPSGNSLLGVAADLLGGDDQTVDHHGPIHEINDRIVSQNPLPDAFVINADGQIGGSGNGGDTFAPDLGGYAYDFAGVLFDHPQFGVTTVRVQNYIANDGGWWGPTQITNGGAPLTLADVVSPQVQVTFDGGVNWSHVASVISNYRTQYNGVVRGTGFPNATSGPLATLTFPEQNGINGIRLIGEGAGPADGSGFIGVTEFEVFGVAPELMLEVNTVSGRVRLFNDSLSPITFDLYRINSPSGSLDLSAEGWNSLDSPSLNPAGFPSGTGTGNGWERMANLNSRVVAEAFLQGSSTLEPDEFASLGELYTGAVPDLSLRYRSTDGTFIDIAATYVSTPELAADFNDDDLIDAADLAVWQSAFGLNAEGDADGDGDTDGRDFLVWQRGFGSTSAVALQTIPEPSPCLLSISLLGLQRALRRGQL